MQPKCPKPPKDLWFVYSISADGGGREAVHWFGTLEDAHEFRMSFMATPHSVEISRPVKYVLADAVESWL